MLRVGLTGDLGSGKSTVARLLSAHGAHIFSSDEIGRTLMQPGQSVFKQIVEHFGPSVLNPDGTLDRPELARLAFHPTNPRAEELNAIVHPAVLAEQARLLADLAGREPDAIAVIESALIFTTRHAGATGWQKRFDVVVLVTASEANKVGRHVDRVANARDLPAEQIAAHQAEARRRLALQTANQQHEAEALVLRNDGSLEDLRASVDALWTALLRLQTETQSHTSKSF